MSNLRPALKRRVAELLRDAEVLALDLRHERQYGNHEAEGSKAQHRAVCSALEEAVKSLKAAHHRASI